MKDSRYEDDPPDDALEAPESVSGQTARFIRVLPFVLGAVLLVVLYGLFISGRISLPALIADKPTALPIVQSAPGKPVVDVKTTSPAEYIKNVAAYAEGYKAFQIYFTLADRGGQLVASDGTAQLLIEDESKTLFSTTYPVNASDFVDTTVGQGALAHPALICVIGRLTYDRFSRVPSSTTGTVKIFFTTSDGRRLEGQDTVLFDK